MLARYIAVGCYTVFIVVIGLLGHRRTKNFNDYLLGGGKVGPWMTAFSYGTAYFSAVLFIGFAGSIGWGFGLSGLWVALGNSIIGVLGVWLLLGNRIKQAAVKYDVYTMPGFLEARFGSLVLVERGECPLGQVYATDAAISDKVRVAGHFPPDSHTPIVYPAALVKQSPAARSFLDFLQSEPAARVFETYGFTVR
jgi:hypothetical protein